MIGDYTWDLNPEDPMILLIKHKNEVIMRIFVGEIMESAGRTAVMKHANECDRSLWISSWHDEAWQILKT